MRHPPNALALSLLLAAAGGSLFAPRGAEGQLRPAGFTIEEILSVPFPYELVSARGAERIAWIEREQGRRNVYAAAGPDFAPVRLTRHDEDDGVDLTSLQLSADGSVAIYIRGHERNRSGRVGNAAADPEGGKREVWAVSTAGSRAPWRVVAADDAHLSPDGKWVLYERDGQIHRAAVDPGNDDPATLDAAAPLFRPLGANGSPVWSPDGRKIAFVTTRHDQRELFPSRGEPRATHSFVMVYDLDRRDLTYLAPGVDFDSNPVWSPDGTRVAFLRRPGLPFGARADVPADLPRDQVPAGFLEARLDGGHTLGVMVADPATGEAREVWRNAPGDSLFAEVRSILWVGDRILFEAEPENWAHWFSVPAAGPPADPVLLTPGEGEVEHVAPSADGRWLYYTSNAGDLDRRDLWRVPVAGGRAERLTRGSGIETFPAVLASGRRVAVLRSGPREPLAVTLLDASSGEADGVVGPRLPEGFPAARHVEPTTVVIEAGDGVEAHSLLFLPPDLRPGERRPALVFVHGGPGMQTVLGYHYEGSHGFYHMTYGFTQYLVNRGYVVLSVNYRAGTGYGRAFRRAPELRDRGNAEYRDVLAAGRWLSERPEVDPERIGIWGLSYGAWLAGQALSRDSELFRSGATIAGVHFRSTSLDPDDLAYQSSPAYNVERWTSPILVIHGDDDRNVAFGQTVGLVQLLRAHSIPHEVIVFPDDTHYFHLHHRWIRAFRAMDDFLERTLLPRGTSSEAAGGGPR